MRTLPKNISAHPDGWLVRVERLGVRYQAFVAYHWKPSRPSLPSLTSRETSLARAIALRDGFYRIAGECSRPKVLGPHARGHSNTGTPGISESCHWSHQRPHPCFIVHFRCLRPDGSTRGNNKRFYYGGVGSRTSARPREQAFKAAKQFREKFAIRVHPCPSVVKK